MPYGKTYLQAHCRISLYTSILNGHKKDINSSLYIFWLFSFLFGLPLECYEIEKRVGYINYINNIPYLPNNIAKFRNNVNKQGS